MVSNGHHHAGTATNGAGASGRPTIVSFYAGAPYYHIAGRRLTERCAELGLEADIVELDVAVEEDWSDICRKKLGFYREMLVKHERPIMWVDVDAEIVDIPNGFSDGAYDVGIFLRNFQYLPSFNPLEFARTFHPGYILFNHNKRVLRFLEFADGLQRASDLKATDDYYLEEAFRTFSEPLRFLLLSPQDIARNQADAGKSETLFKHGDSGNVREWVGKVEQHETRALSPRVQKLVLQEAVRAAAAKRNPGAVRFLYERMLQVDPNDVETYPKLQKLLRRSRDQKGSRHLFEASSESAGLAQVALRDQYEHLLQSRRWGAAAELYRRIAEQGDDKTRAFAESRRFRYSFDQRADRKGLDDARRVHLYWWEQPFPGNLGDIVNPFIIEKLTGTPPKYAPKGEGLLAIGSVIKFATTGTPVWGSGTPSSTEPLTPDAVYHAVRGPLTRERVIASGGDCPAVYGDPAWFLPVLYNPPVEKTARTGLILHFAHEEFALDVDPSVKRIPIRRVGTEAIKAFLDELRSCERIISTSLHGVIIAQAYGIPAAWATVSESATQIHGDGIKFQDYFASVGHGRIEPIELAGARIGDDAFEGRFLRARQPIDLVKLAEAAPFAVEDKQMANASRFMSKW